MNEKLLQLIGLVLKVDWTHSHIATMHVSSGGIHLQVFKLGQLNSDIFYSNLESDDQALATGIAAVESILDGTFHGEETKDEHYRQSVVGIIEG